MIEASQCRAARGLLGWSQAELAKEAGLSVLTINTFERDASVPRLETLFAIVRALSGAGVHLAAHGGVSFAPPKAPFIERDASDPADPVTKAQASRFLNVRRKLRGEPLLPESE